MASAAVMVVEDEGTVALELSDALQEMGYDVPVVAARGAEAIRAMTDHDIDIVLMDVRLAGTMDGIEAAQSITTSTHVPVIYLSAYSDQETMERVKQTTPFGYLVKPVDLRTLNATIQVALERAAQMDSLAAELDAQRSTPLLHDGGLIVDVLNRTVTVDGEPVVLTPTECSLLEYLMVNKGNVCAREDIIRAVWAHYPYVSPNIVDVYVRYLRVKIQQDGDWAPIVAVRGKGYRFVPTPPDHPSAVTNKG